MRNFIICQNCKQENSFYKSNCSKCGSILRTRVVNIDLWHTIWLLIESPKEAFKTIIFAEHKNFTILLSIFIAMKLFINSYFTINILYSGIYSTQHVYTEFGLTILSVMIAAAVLAFIYKYFARLFNIEVRFRDNYSILIFSFLPMITMLVFLFPVEYALFGSHWIFFNPSPFEMKGNAAYILSIIEMIAMLWTIILLVKGISLQTKSAIYSVFAALLQFFVMFLIPRLIYSIFN